MFDPEAHKQKQVDRFEHLEKQNPHFAKLVRELSPILNDADKIKHTVTNMRDGLLVMRESDSTKSQSAAYVRLLPEGMPREISQSLINFVIIDVVSRSKDNILAA